MSDLEFPDVGSRWIHRLGGRVIKVVGLRTLADGARLVEFKYRRTVGGMARNRTTPTQTLELGQWRGLFTKQAED